MCSRMLLLYGRRGEEVPWGERDYGMKQNENGKGDKRRRAQ